ncbi:MAG: entericidin A/B family lipoprotein [Betaproteobacteria bacterium]
MLKMLAWMLSFAAFAVAIAGCNTIEGAGKDVKAAGGAVEKAADKAKTY